MGLRQIKGLRRDDADRIVAARKQVGSFTSLTELQYAAGIDATAVRRLADAGALTSLRLNRRAGAWEAMTLSDTESPLFDGQADAPSPSIVLPSMHASAEVTADYATTGLSLRPHPVSFVRHRLNRWHVTPAGRLQDADRFPDGRRVSVAGLVLVRQRPGTASGVVFVTLEDETGIVNLILWSRVYERYRRATRHATLLQADGIVQRQGQVIHVLAKRLADRTMLLSGLAQASRDFH